MAPKCSAPRARNIGPRAGSPAVRAALPALLLPGLLLHGCASAPRLADEEVPIAVVEALAADEAAGESPTLEDSRAARAPATETETETATPSPPSEPVETLPEVVVAGQRPRHELIRDLVAEARALLSGVELEYVLTGRGRRETLRGRPIAFALWSESRMEWVIAHLEIPRPPVRWRPGGAPLQFRLRTPGIEARHVKGTGAERLMFAFSRNGEPLRVFGRKFPVFDNDLIAKRRWRAVVRTARPIVYLPFTSDTLDPEFVSGGREFLLATARRALEELRAARVPSLAYPGELLADIVPAEVVTTLAVIEQTDDTEFMRQGLGAFEEVLSQYGLKREEAFRYSVSSARALGPMQFTNRRGNGTYALVVRTCRGARIDPDFERGATNLHNAMKAAICLLDLELAQMRADVRAAYRADPAVLGIFPVAAYNGGPRNVARLYGALSRLGVAPEDLTRPGEHSLDLPVSCPCVWRRDGEDARPVPIPRYNNENRWYIEKYQHILALFE